MRRRRPGDRSLARPGHRAGLTLVELMVVLLLLGVMAAAVAPAIARQDRTGAGPALKVMEAVLAGAREHAVARAITVTAEIELASGAYVVVATPQAADPADTLATGLLPLGDAAIFDGPPGERATFVFDPLGRARGPDLVVREYGDRHELRIDPWTGKTRLVR
jgi:prepilin-type N-terminal cleavage/methylation domain-containing protein